VARLVDSNILVYRFDPRDPVKQRVAEQLLREGAADRSLALPHQALVEFFAAVVRPRADLSGAPLLPVEHARIETEGLMTQFRVVYPNREVVQTALRGMAMYGLSWFDAHLWAFAEVYGFAEILSADFTHGRHYGTVRVVNPFAGVEGVHELPPLYA
jgi:predicted nucleic acid-binding protein